MLLDGRNSNFGTSNEKYKFTGKERDDETSYDYFGVRYYDSRIGRWLQVDPLAEKYSNISSFVYCHNSPIIMFDPDGLGDYYSRDGRHLGSDGKKDNLAYVATGVQMFDIKDETGNVIGQKPNFENAEELSVSNSVLNQYANTVAVESSGDREESFAIASTIKNLAAYKGKSILYTLEKDGIYGYGNGGSSTKYNGNKEYGMSAAINALTGGSDYSNGALRWDGADFYRGDNHPKVKYSGVEISEGLFSKFKAAYNNKGFPNGFNAGEHKATAGPNRNQISYKAVAVCGKTIFWGAKTFRRGL
jgi:RHS repeat-associated protein